MGQAEMTTTRTHFTFRIDTWTPDGDSIVEHIAGVEDYQVWPMNDRFLEDRRDDPKVRWFELKLGQWRWGTLAESRRRRFGLAR